VLSELAVSIATFVVKYLDRRSVVIFGTTFEEGMIVVVARSVSSSPAMETSVLVEDSFATVGDLDGTGLVVVTSTTSESCHELIEIVVSDSKISTSTSETSMLADSDSTSARTRWTGVENFDRGSIVISSSTFEECVIVVVAGSEGSSPAMETSVLIEDSFATVGDLNGTSLVVVSSTTSESPHETVEIAVTDTETSNSTVEITMLEDLNSTST
jgi:ABC-type amino acid transport substrate-binding protein